MSEIIPLFNRVINTMDLADSEIKQLRIEKEILEQEKIFLLCTIEKLEDELRDERIGTE
jgi:hypothetical protein